jgi:hypothetical protein
MALFNLLLSYRLLSIYLFLLLLFCRRNPETINERLALSGLLSLLRPAAKKGMSSLLAYCLKSTEELLGMEIRWAGELIRSRGGIPTLLHLLTSKYSGLVRDSEVTAVCRVLSRLCLYDSHNQQAIKEAKGVITLCGKLSAPDASSKVISLSLLFLFLMLGLNR